MSRSSPGTGGTAAILPAPPPVRYERRTLPNGLDVIVYDDHRLPIVAVNLWYHVGSKNEEPGRRGFAHLFEHLMFEGSEHYPGDFFKPLQRLGASVNGSTSTDRTNYFVDLPAASAELALAMESDRMGFFLPALSADKLRVQKDVVKNEYRQNYANRPYGQAWALLAEALYPPGHPYRWLTIGAMEEVEAATLDDVEGFFRRYYVPANASLCLAGAIDPEVAFALADRYFGPLPGGAPAATLAPPPVALRADRPIRLADRVELDRLYLSWPTVPQFHSDDAPLGLVGDLLARGRSSRLYRRLVMGEELAQDVSAHHGGRELAGSFGVVVTARPGRDLGRIAAIVDDEVADLAANGPRPDELERARTGRVAAYLYALDNLGGFGGVADRLNAYNTYLGDPSRISADFTRFADANAADLAAVTALYLAGRPRVALSVVGHKARSIAPALDRASPPSPGSAVHYRAPSPEIRTLKNGATLWALPRRDLPIVAATAVVAAGASAHGPERGGLAHLTAGMMDEGTTTRSALDLARAAEDLATSLSSSCGWDGSYVGFQCLAAHLSPTLDLATDVLFRPSFPESEWTRVHAQALAGLKADRDRAESRAHRGLLGALYPSGHPYRVPVDGSESSVAALALADLVTFHADRYRPAAAHWVVAGDVDPDDLARRLDDLLPGSGVGPAPAVPASPADPAPTGRRLLLIHRPGAAQAVLRVGHLGIARSDPDHDALMLVNHALGGQFTSRLNARLREEKGYTYGVRSGFDPRRAAGPFTVSASIQTDKVADALADLAAEIEALLDHRPLTPGELDDARRAMVEGQARHFETPSALVSRFASLLLHGLPPDHHADAPARLDAITLDQARDAARRHLRPDRLVAVVVADVSTVRGALESLGFGELEVVDAATLENMLA